MVHGRVMAGHPWIKMKTHQELPCPTLLIDGEPEMDPLL